MTPDFDELRRTAEAATQSQWFVGRESEGYDTPDATEILFDGGLIADTGASTCDENEDRANAAHIAAFCPPVAIAIIDHSKSETARANAAEAALATERERVKALCEVLEPFGFFSSEDPSDQMYSLSRCLNRNGRFSAGDLRRAARTLADIKAVDRETGERT